LQPNDCGCITPSTSGARTQTPVDTQLRRASSLLETNDTFSFAVYVGGCDDDDDDDDETRC
jgi:hypothetical protein